MTDQPSNAPTDLKDLGREDARDDAQAAAILSDANLAETPGGGGLGGADADGGTAGATGGPSLNTPSDISASAGEAGAAREARLRSTDETTR